MSPFFQNSLLHSVYIVMSITHWEQGMSDKSDKVETKLSDNAKFFDNSFI